MIRPISEVSAIVVDDQSAGHTQSSFTKTGDLYSSATMSESVTLTQTTTALDLAGKGKAKDTGGTFFRTQSGGGPPAGGSGGGGPGVLCHSRDIHPTWASVNNVTATLRVWF